MPFGLTNAPATFCTLHNELFHPYLDDWWYPLIAGYSHSLNDHVSHLRTVKEEEPLCKEREMLLCLSPRSPFLSFKLSSRRSFVRCSSADDEVFVVLLGSVGTGKGFGSVGKDPSGELYSLGPGFEGPPHSRSAPGLRSSLPSLMRLKSPKAP